MNPLHHTRIVILQSALSNLIYLFNKWMLGLWEQNILCWLTKCYNFFEINKNFPHIEYE